MKSARLARVSTAIGLVIAAAGAVFVVLAISRQWASVRSALAHTQPAWLVAGFLVAAVAMLTVAVRWRGALRLLGLTADRIATVTWFFVGEIGKYVPGAIWPVVGRAELARRGGFPRWASYASVALSLGALYLAGMVMVLILLPFQLLDTGTNDALWVVALVPVGLALLHHRPLGWMVGRAERLLKRPLEIEIPRWSASLRLVASYVPSWVLAGTVTFCIARAFGQEVSWLTIAPAAVLAWVVGFLLVPVPGGVGVREAVFVALVAGVIPSGVAATIAITARLAFMLVDALGAALGVVVLRRLPPGATDDLDGSPTGAPA